MTSNVRVTSEYGIGGGVERSGRGLTGVAVSALLWRSGWNDERTRKILCSGRSSLGTPPARKLEVLALDDSFRV
jgi:hypothetical protein